MFILYFMLTIQWILDFLPVYLRGGVSTVGFGDLLGNALALLYVARQGLREAELWSILSLLQYKGMVLLYYT